VSQTESELTEAQRQVLAELSEMIVEVIGEDYLLDVAITMDTSFQDDLEIESIEFVALSEKLYERYEKVDFVEWIADKDLDEIIALRVGELVDLVVASL
jgi:acyl carrier protein